MKDKILQALKTKYATLGLSDGVFQAQADALASLGFVTDENLAAVVSAQEGTFKALQGATDKRVAAALGSVTAAKQSEIDKLKAEYEAKLAKLAEQGKQQEQPKPENEQKPDPAPNFDAEAFRKQIMEQMSEQFKQVAETNKALTDKVAALETENANFKAAETAKQRAAFIQNKAKELGIPQWRQDEGFSFGADATEDSITQSLTKVAENINANILPKGGVGIPTAAGGADSKVVENVAKSLINRI